MCVSICVCVGGGYSPFCRYICFLSCRYKKFSKIYFSQLFSNERQAANFIVHSYSMKWRVKNKQDVDLNEKNINQTVLLMGFMRTFETFHSSLYHMLL